MNTSKILSVIFFLILAAGFLNCRQLSPTTSDSIDEIHSLDKKIVAGCTASAKAVFHKFLETMKNSNYYSLESQFNFDQIEQVQLTETSTKILVIRKLKKSQDNSICIFGFLKNDQVLPFFVINEIIKLGEQHYLNNLKLVSGTVFFSLEVKDLKVRSITGTKNISLNKNDPNKNSMMLSEFTDCVSRWMATMSSGSLGGTVLALGCMAQGGVCAAMITGNCLAKQVESWLGLI